MNWWSDELLLLIAKEFCCDYTYVSLKKRHIYITFTFMHLADAFIQSDLHCILSYSFTFYQLLLSLGIEPMLLALLAPCSTIWATGKLNHHVTALWNEIMILQTDTLYGFDSSKKSNDSR